MEKKAEDAKEPLNPMSYESLGSFTIFDEITYACTATSILRGGWKNSNRDITVPTLRISLFSG